MDKCGKGGEGEAGEMCYKVKKAGKIEWIFSFSSVQNSANLSASGLGGFIDGSSLGGSLYNTSPKILHNLRVVMIFMNFCSQKMRFDLHADSIVLVNFLHIF